MTKRVTDIIVLNDQEEERTRFSRATRTAIGRRQQPGVAASEPVSGMIVGTPRPQAGMAIRPTTEASGRNYVELSIVVHPNTRVGFLDTGEVNASSGLSSTVVQLQERDEGDFTSARDQQGQSEPPRVVGAGPWSNQLRVVDDALCLLGNDPQEHHAADPAYTTGGGFLAFASHDRPGSFVRTRTGDIWGPMRHGLPQTPSRNHLPPPQEITEASGDTSGDRTIPRFLDPLGAGEAVLTGARKLLGSVLDNE